MKVIGLERGPRLTTQDFTHTTNCATSRAWTCVQTPSASPSPGGRTPMGAPPGSAAGLRQPGRRRHRALWLGVVAHARGRFSARARRRSNATGAAIPQDSSLADWPLSYGDLEPYYDRAEYELGVFRQGGNLQGKKIDGGNVFEAPRRRDYRCRHCWWRQAGVAFLRPERRSSAIIRSRRRARSCRSRTRPAGLHLCGFLPGLRLPRRAKFSISSPSCPRPTRPATSSSITGAMAYRVNSDTSGRATGVSYYGPDGSDNTIEAELVIMTTFIYDNTRLLLLSKTDKFPNGLAIRADSSASTLMAHMMANVFVGLRRQHMNIYMGPSAQKHTLDDFNAEISTTAASASSAARRSRSAPATCRAARSR